MPAGAGGTSDVLYNAGGFPALQISLAGLKSFGLRIPGLGGPNFGNLDLGRLRPIFPQVPVGMGDPAVLAPRAELSTVDAGATVPEGMADLAKIDRRDQPPNEEQLSMPVIKNGLYTVDNWLDYWELVNKGFKVLHEPSGTVHGGMDPPLPPPPKPKDTSMPLDLGQLIDKGLDIYTQVQNLKNLDGRSTFYQPALNTPMPDALEQYMPWYDESTGQTVLKPKFGCKRRRRRRPIVTNAEIGQLQGLTSVLKGDTLKVFLAKRVRS